MLRHSSPDVKWNVNTHLLERKQPAGPFKGSGRLMMFLNGRNLRQIEAVQVHHLDPSRDEVVNKLLLGISAGIDFRQGAQA